jgi:hypothetical protein
MPSLRKFRTATLNKIGLDPIDTLLRSMRGQTGNSKAEQIRLMLSYQQMAQAGGPMPNLADTEFAAFSQEGEDGNLLYLLSVVGMETRIVVELGCGQGTQNMSANLIVNHGFNGLLVDGSQDNIDYAKAWFGRRPQTRLYPPQLSSSWVTRDNVNDLMTDHSVSGEVDLFSLDLDGNDYWIWKNLIVIQPRVVVVEFNNLWGAADAVSVPYIEDFEAVYTASGLDYGGASLAAFDHLAQQKGYHLVGTNINAYNAYFVRNDLATDLLPEVSVAQCLAAPFAKYSVENRQAGVRSLEWVDVTG